MVIKMFITKFIKSDEKPDENYYYHSKKEAVDHLKLFFNDDSKLYEKIQVINDETDEIIMTLPFDDNGSAGIITIRR